MHGRGQKRRTRLTAYGGQEVAAVGCQYYQPTFVTVKNLNVPLFTRLSAVQSFTLRL
ncbi:MAG: hypothetical protein HFI82_12870 [Eubacterium sp.]|jgi:hypothetical protein|nr:hypothetical protein [Eubacterium sp.]